MCLGSCESRADTLPDAFPFEFRDRAEDVEPQSTGRCSGVDSLIQGHEPDAHGRELVEQEDQVSQAAAQTIQAPAHQRVYLTPPRGPNQIIERRSRLLGTGHPRVNELA
jgi:hypothetical protein